MCIQSHARSSSWNPAEPHALMKQGLSCFDWLALTRGIFGKQSLRYDDQKSNYFYQNLTQPQQKETTVHFCTRGAEVYTQKRSVQNFVSQYQYCQARHGRPSLGKEDPNRRVLAAVQSPQHIRGRKDSHDMARTSLHAEAEPHAIANSYSHVETLTTRSRAHRR